MFKQNKYTKWYYSIIQHRSQHRLDGYTEKHHIIPKSLGGSNAASNIVALSAREHFVCHMLLVRMLEGPMKHKMAFALNRLTHSGKVTVTPRTYAIAKEMMSQASVSLWTTERKEALAERQRARWKDDEYRQKMARVIKDLWSDPEKRKQRGADLTKIWSDPDRRQKQSEVQKALGPNPLKSLPGGKNGMYGRVRTDEEKQKIREGRAKRTNEQDLISYSRVKSEEEIAKILASRPSQVGANNPKAKIIILTTPTGEEVVCHGTFRVTCEQLGISWEGMRRLLWENRTAGSGALVGYSARYA
jgi:5-methylcytosine-specific restriction endonuclease McrA